VNESILNSPPITALLITPYYKTQRGNSLTSHRIMTGLKRYGFQIELISMEDSDWVNQLRNMLEYNQISLVHGLHAYYFFQAMQMVPQLLNFPLLLTLTGTDINVYLQGAQGEEVLRCLELVDKIVVFNESARQELISIQPHLAIKLYTIPQGLWLREGSKISREELGLLPENVVFLLPSGLRRIKNIEMAIDALESIYPDFPQLHLLIIGAPIEKDYSAMIKQRAKSLPWVTYLGELPHASIKAYYQLGDIVLNTSESEGQPQAALEAMSLGLPAILTPVPGNLGLIQNNVQGFYAANKIELARYSRMLLADQELRHRLGTAAKEMVRVNFPLEKELSAYARIYRDLGNNRD
jgi:glycosyltransferase involved in cell wall biosynthesis